MKSIQYFIEFRGVLLKKKKNSKHQWINFTSLIGGKKPLLRNKFRILLDYFALTGNTEYQHDGQFGGGKFLFGERRYPRVYDLLHYTTVRPCSASLSSNSKIV